MPRHVVTFSYGLWGHLRPQISLVSRLIMAEPNILVTMIFDSMLMDKTKVQAQLKHDLEGKNAENVTYRTITVVNMFDGESIEAEFEKVYSDLLENASVKPDVFLGEMGPYDTGSIVRRLSKEKTPKIVFWYPGPLSALYTYAHRWRDDIDRLMDIDFMALATYDQNRELPITGLPTISGNELFPQPVTQSPPFAIHVLAAKSTQMWLASDAMLGGTSEVLEPQQAAELRAAMRKRGRELFLVGDNNRTVDATAVEPGVVSFLEARSPKSVLYIGFGSLTTHNTPEKFHAFMDVVLELGIPFILAHGDHAAPLPERFAKAQLGLVLKWAPQEYILSHPSTRWFLSHAGFTSTKESLSAGVPIICWPLQYDQPILAIIIAQVLGAGYELEEVRGGELGLQQRRSNGKKPVGSVEAVSKEAREVLQKAFFDEQEHKKKQEVVSKICKNLNSAWDVTGVSTGEVKRFLEFISSV